LTAVQGYAQLPNATRTMTGRAFHTVTNHIYLD